MTDWTKSLASGLVLVAWIGLGLSANTLQAQAGITYELSKIDEGTAWVSSYWGYNTPKLVYDGETYYTVALWGDTQATATGAVYALRHGQWEKGYTWEGLNYQPGMLLLDSQQRLVLIYPRIDGGPVIMRAQTRGDMVNFEPIDVPAQINKAGYMGAGIHDDRIVLGYIGDPETYSFNIALLDLKTMEWDGPHMLARAQRQQEPWTTWLYPIILPDANGFHMTVSNQPDPTAIYNAILYIYIPYDQLDHPPAPEVVARADPWSNNMAFGEAMWRARDGSIYITGQHKPEGGDNWLHVYRRDPQSQAWSGVPISTSQVAAVFQDGRDRLWLTSTYWDALRLYAAADQGQRWDVVELPGFTDYGLVSSFFLHGIHTGSGSVLPEAPAAVFSAGPHPQYQLWFVRFDTSEVPTAVEATGAAPDEYRMEQNYPNPFNSSTVIRFALPVSQTVELSLYNLAGQRVVRLVQGVQPAGEHAIRWDGKDAAGRALPSGIYLYRLQRGPQTETRRIALIR